MLENPRHPIWKTMRVAVVGGILLGTLALIPDDVIAKHAGVILTAIAGLVGFDVAKDRIVNRQQSQHHTEEDTGPDE